MSPRPPARRGACPAFETPMETGDGLIIRLVPSDGVLTPAQLRGLAAAALAHGNGLLEITARGSVQIRGLRPHTVAPLQERVLALGIAPRPMPAIDISPLSGIDPSETADPRPLAARIRAGAAHLAGRLGPKVSVVVDGGGAISLRGRKADVRLRAMAGNRNVWALTIGGGPAAMLPAPEAVERVLGALADLAALGRTARATDLPGGAAPGSAPAESAALPPPPLGRLPLTGGVFAVGIGLPFGTATAQLAGALADAAEAAGARDLRPGPERTLIATGLCEATADAFRLQAAALGCLEGPDDPRAAVAACPGAPACASAHVPARDLAPRVAAALAPLLDGSVSVHLSACPKGCAHPAAATLTLVGLEGGVAMVHEGTAVRGAGLPVRPVERLIEDLAALAGTPRTAGESGRAFLARIHGTEARDPPGDFNEMIGTGRTAAT